MKNRHPFKFKEKDKMYEISIFDSNPELSGVSKVKCIDRRHSPFSGENEYRCEEINSAKYGEDYASRETKDIPESKLTKDVREAVQKVLAHRREAIFEYIEEYKEDKKLFKKYILTEEPNSVKFIKDEN